MLSAVATPPIPASAPLPTLPSQHQYGTRIRSNSVIKPSVRLRQNPDTPRRIKPVPALKAKAAAAHTHHPAVSPIKDTPTEMPQFPPPNVMLHSEDATSKVFIAIGRSFMSVDNKAMTIKDLAEMTIKFGLMCQNVSAAGQAITTYIRNHMQRCDDQQDQPLLLRHVLSGTPSDDDLVPALHSRVGGAHCTLNPGDNRITNFRRGTMVWYLSRAAGVPCPFARAGIRLCEYGENGRVGTEVNPGKERKRERDRLRRAEQCGQKRKRPTRACAARASDHESSSEDDKPAPKVKLTLRLNPSLVARTGTSPAPPSSPSASEVIDLSRNSDSDDSDSDSMSVDSSDEEDEVSEESWRLPPYPRRTISIPSCTPSREDSLQPFPSSPNASRTSAERPWRSPSVPYTAASASPPPESEDEADSLYGMSSSGRFTSVHSGSRSSLDHDEDEDDDDFFADMEDNETHWGESPGPMSPPAQFDDEEVHVKEEPRDVRGFLDAWEDLDASVTALKVAEGIHTAPVSSTSDVFKLEPEELDLWAWDNALDSDVGRLMKHADEYAAPIKTEDDDSAVPLEPCSSMSPSMSPRSPFSSLPTPSTPPDSSDDAYITIRRSSHFSWKDAELLGPNSVKPHDLDNGMWRLDTTRHEAKMAEEPLATAVSEVVEILTSASQAGGSRQASPSVAPRESAQPHSHDRSLGSIEHSAQGIVQPPESPAAVVESPHVLSTCQPCVPAICATQLEGIPVYQMVLGSSCILRRIDTDFINITPILQFFGLDHPDPSSIPSSVIITKGSSLVCGIWAALATARDLFQTQPLLKIFLSDELQQQFPEAVQRLCSENATRIPRGNFGPPFKSVIDAKRESTSSFRLDLSPRSPVSPWELGHASNWDVEDHLLSVHPPFALGSTKIRISAHSEDIALPETPLSPKEEEMFHALCTAADWEPSIVADVVAQTEQPSRGASPVVPMEEEEEEDAPPAVDVAKPLPQVEVVVPPRERHPVRRSKRVANAVVSRPRTRSMKGGAKAC